MKNNAAAILWVVVIVGCLGIKAWTSFGEKAWKSFNARPTHSQTRHPLPPNQRNITTSTATNTPHSRPQAVVDFEPYSGYSEELFPSRVLTMAGRQTTSQYRKKDGEAPRYGISGTIGVIIRNVRRGESYTVEIDADRMIGTTKETFVMQEDAGVVLICPRLNYDYVNLRRNTQTSFINVSFKVLKDNQADGTAKIRRWQVHQINDCPILLEHKTLRADGSLTAERKKQSWVVAGYVNENHPWIDTLLLEAKATGICSEFIGYQGGNRKIGPQIRAIWKALQNRGLSYSSIATSTASNYHSLQHIRFLDQSISATQANCIDGSVLLCSMLRKIGFNVGIMLVPGHAYVCIGDQTNESYLFAIETTMLGKSDLEQAVRAATETERYALNKWNDDKEGRYDLVDITKLRKEGIQPIPFDDTVATPAAATASAAPADNVSPEEAYRQQRIIIANQLRQQVIDLQANLSHRNEERYRIAAFNLFNEIRKHQSAFNALFQKPSLKRSGVQSADDKMQDNYSEIIQTLLNRSIPVDTEIKESDLEAARTLADALVGLASLPLNF